MVVDSDELVAIIGGSLGGLVLLLIVLACIIHYACGRRRRNDKDARRFRQLPSNTDTGNSKHSGPNGYDPRMDIHAADPRLPKVGSSGLWVGAPSMYSKGPSDAYFIDRPKRSSSLQRASSETRLAGTPKNSAKKKRDSQQKKNVNSPQGHMVYQGNIQPIYHSQQIPGVYQPYEMAPHRSSYMQGLYPYPYGHTRDSRAILVEYPDEQQYYYNYRAHADEERRPSAKVKRTHSDLTGTKRKKERRRRESPSFSGNRDNKPRTASVEVHKPRAPSQTRDSSSQTRHRQTRESYTPSEEQSKTMDFKDQEISTESITDSAKLRAIQGSSKEPELSNKWKESEDLKLNLPASDDEDDKLETSVQVQRYSYEGKLSSQQTNLSSSQKYENSVVTKMDALMEDNSQGIVKAIVGPGVTGHTNQAFSPDEIPSTSTARKAVTDKVDYPDEVLQKPRVEKLESNADGKQVSAAFDFLNNYLSDDEGTEHFESRNQSPIPFA